MYCEPEVGRAVEEGQETLMYTGDCNERTIRSRTCSWQTRLGKCLEMELIMPQLEPPQAIHTPMSLHESNEMGRKHSWGLALLKPYAITGKSKHLIQGWAIVPQGKTLGLPALPRGHKWVQETRGDLHKGKELNLTAHERGTEQTGPCAPALGTDSDLQTNTWEAVASLNLLFLKLQGHYVVFLPNTAIAIKSPAWQEHLF